MPRAALPLARLVCLLVLSPLLVLRCNAVLLSSSKLTKCIDDGTLPLACANKMVVTLAVSASGATQALVGSAATDDGSSVLLATPIRIEVVKDARPRTLFPIAYVQSVNAGPAEAIVSRTSFETCVTSGSSPTCGWYYGLDGRPVPQSSGFCCACTFGQASALWACARIVLSTHGPFPMQVFSGDRSPDTRAGNSCGVASLFGSSTFTTAHCLRFADRWYDAYSIGTAETSYSITVRLTTVNARNQTVVEDLFVGPDRLTAASASGYLLAELVGDFQSFKAVADLQGFSLFIPSRPVTDARVQLGMAAAQLLPRDLVDLTGFTPNKVGVSFAGFANQPHACEGAIGDGLRGQLNDYHAADVASAAAGLPPRYWASAYGNVSALQSTVTGLRYLAYNVVQPARSVVTLTFAADDLRFVVNRSPGKINSAYVDTFEAQSRAGVMHVLVTNTGRIVADYTLSVTQCSANIMAVLGQQASIAAYQSQWFEFAIRSQIELASSNACTVRLLDSTGALQDEVVVRFNTTDTIKTSGAQSGAAPNASTTKPYGPNANGNGQSCDSCALFNLSCQLLGGCFANLLKAGAATLLPVAGVLLAIKLLTSPTCRACLCAGRAASCCLGGIGGGDNDTSQRSDRKREKRERRRRERAESFDPMLFAPPAPPSSPVAADEVVFFNVARPDAPFSVPGRLIGADGGGGDFVFLVDSRHALARTLPRTTLTAAEARAHITRAPLY